MARQTNTLALSPCQISEICHGCQNTSNCDGEAFEYRAYNHMKILCKPQSNEDMLQEDATFNRKGKIYL